jgi:matrixin
MEESRRFVFSLGVAILLALAFPGVLAAHVEPMSVPELAAASPHVVVAVVESRETRWNAQHTLLTTAYTLRVEDRLRGQAPERISLSIPGGTLGRVTDETCLTVHLEPGARYLLFLGDLDRPSLTPVTGAHQGMFREVTGTDESLVAAGEDRTPLVLDGRPVRFSDLVAAVRPLAAKALPPPGPPTRSLPAKTWDPAAAPAPVAGSLPPLSTFSEKFVYFARANPPIVINPLTDSEFSPWDQQEMAYWNLYAGDLFRVSASPTRTWAYGNGISDITGFPGEQQMKAQFGYGWGEFPQGVLAVTFRRDIDGVVVEGDVAFNPLKAWTVDDVEGLTSGAPYSFKEVALHELGHVWGLEHPWETQHVTWDSVMNYRSKIYYVVELFADDTAAVRKAFPPGRALRDGLISSYITLRGRFDLPDYLPALPMVSTVRPGGSFNLSGPIKIENPGTVLLTNLTVEVYLAPERLSLEGAVLLKRARVQGRVAVGGTLKVGLGSLRVPPNAPAGTYYLAFYLRDPKDVYQGNNGAWSNEDVTVTVTPR